MTAYSKLKIFHYPAKLASLTGDVLPPLHVRLKPTNVCNHRCAYCAYRQPDLQLGEQMNERDSIPPEKMLEIENDLIFMGVRAVTFSGGGEPLCYPGLDYTVGHLALEGVKVATLTNGSRLDGIRAEVFSKCATWARVSIDGWDGPSYARYRGVGEDAFEKVIQNLANFQALGGPCKLSACVNVNADNAAHVYSLISTLVKQAGVKSIKVSPIIVANDARANYDYHKPHTRTVRRQVALARESFPGVDLWNDYKAGLESFNKEYTWCPMLQVRPVIGADLNVYSCQDRSYTEGGKLFSIKEQSFRDGWMRGDWRTKINPARDCTMHCVSDGQNKLITEYLGVTDPEFV